MEWFRTDGKTNFAGESHRTYKSGYLPHVLYVLGTTSFCTFDNREKLELSTSPF